MDKRRLIREAAEEEAWELVRRASLEAERLLAEARKEAQKVREEILAEVRSWLFAEEARRLSLAQREVRERLLGEAQRAVERWTQEARRRLQELRKSPEYKEVLKRLISQVAREGSQILCAPGEGELVKEALRELGLEREIVEDPRVDGGVAARDPQRGLVVWNTFGVRLRRAAEGFAERMGKALGET